MKKNILLLISVSALLNLTAKNIELDSILLELDKTIEHKGIFEKQKEKRIADLKNLLSISDITLEQNYDINTRLYNEYKSFIPDSAIVYLAKNIKIAESIDNEIWVNDSKMNLSLLYSIAGMYLDSDRLLNSIDTKNLHGELRVKYYDIRKQLFYYYPASQLSEKQYNIYRDSLLTLLDLESNFAKIIYSEKLIHLGQYEEARNLLLPMYKDAEPDSHWLAVLAFSIGETYRGEQNYEMQKKYYAISAMSDIKNVIKENASMRALAIAFYETDDVGRSYKYVQQSMEDAIFSNARFRTMEVSQVFPIIEQSYQHKLEKQKNRLFYLLICIGVLSILLAITIVFIYIQLHKLAKARHSLSETNKQLHDLNEDLHKSNRKTQDINKELFEANLLKETYISQFLDTCSMYIDKLEKYQNTLNRKAMDRKMDDLYKMLKSKDMIENEVKELYEIFDNIFLHLYPNFVEEFNSLLLEEEQIQLKPNELLPPELRIFALIRLGITDSSKIASFLRYSTTTIYNYRTRVRNKSAVPRDEFEDYVMKIGVIAK